jgi:hypothetical protein
MLLRRRRYPFLKFISIADILVILRYGISRQQRQSHCNDRRQERTARAVAPASGQTDGCAPNPTGKNLPL